MAGEGKERGGTKSWYCTNLVPTSKTLGILGSFE